MKNFHDFYFGLTGAQRETFVSGAGTTISYAERVAGGYRLPSGAMCARLIRASKGKTDFNAILATFERRNGPV